jgi:hypothetical protein
MSRTPEARISLASRFTTSAVMLPGMVLAAGKPALEVRPRPEAATGVVVLLTARADEADVVPAVAHSVVAVEQSAATVETVADVEAVVVGLSAVERVRVQQPRREASRKAHDCIRIP